MVPSEVMNERTAKHSVFGKKYSFPKNFSDLLQQFSFDIQLGPALYINTESTLVSAPSPIVFPVGIGFIWPRDCFISFQPSISYFMMHYLWYNGKALPAEIENRTATSLSFFMNLPAVFSFYGHYSRAQVAVGAGMLFRIIFLSPGVYEYDSGFSGSAGNDVALINQYFNSGARFLYLTSDLSWLFDITRYLKAGPFTAVYFPLGSLINNEGLSGFMVTAGIRINL